MEFNRENSHLEVDEMFKPAIDPPFSSTTFDDLSTDEAVENPIVLDEEEDKDNAPPAP